MQQIDQLKKYLNIALDRKYWIIIPFLVTILGGLVYFLHAPKVYMARTLILVETQSVPQDLVRSIVTEGVEDRLRSITQEVTSRTNLERIIREHRLSEEGGRPVSLDAMVEAIRREITIDVARPSRGGAAPGSFTISYRGKDPRQVMDVTNALAYNFISQNLELRESQIQGTSSFLSEELESVRRRLTEREGELKAYREQYMGGLPDQLNANLAMIQRLQLQMDQLNSNLRDGENRRLLMQQTIDDARRGGLPVLPSPARSGEAGDLATLRSELAAMEVRLKKRIEILESSGTAVGGASGSPAVTPRLSPAEQNLVQQLRDIELDIAGARAEMKKVQAEMSVYQRRVEETPKREQELYSIERDYDNIKNLYNSLLERKLEADITVSMERKQRGERFRIIDSAKLPSYPVKPDMKMIFPMVLALALGLGAGLAYLREMMDTSYKNPEEAEGELHLPVIGSLGYRYTEKELQRRKLKEYMKGASVAVGFGVSVLCILLNAKGADKTFDFIKSFFIG
jgi:polysaccharide chain length determinant protein (PEP-CTERM system associated)